MIKWLLDRVVKHDFIKLSIDGTYCVMTPWEACQEIQASDEPRAYKIEPVLMTWHQIAQLPEFDGYIKI